MSNKLLIAQTHEQGTSKCSSTQARYFLQSNLSNKRLFSFYTWYTIRGV